LQAEQEEVIIAPASTRPPAHPPACLPACLLACLPACLSASGFSELGGGGSGGDYLRVRSLETIEPPLIYHPVRMQRIPREINYCT